jgi:hypothetical protein
VKVILTLSVFGRGPSRNLRVDALIAMSLAERTAADRTEAPSPYRRLHSDLLDILRAKGIDYTSLRSALTPQSTKHEAAFLFDEQRCDNTFVPGAECADALFNALDRKTTHSILGGELIDDKDEIARTLLRRSANVAKDLNFKHPCFCYVLYVNNLSEDNIAAIDSKLRAHKVFRYMVTNLSKETAAP